MPAPEKFVNVQTTEYGIKRTIVSSSGLVPVPAAGPKSEPAIFVRVHSGIETEIVEWTATSESGPPVVPSPFGKDSPLGLNDNLVLLKSTIGAVVPAEIGGGSPGHVWTISGVYEYARKAQKGITDIPLGKWPYEDQPKNQNYFPAANFSKEILDETIPTAAPDVILQAPIQGP
jgi:hypothetical protein